MLRIVTVILCAALLLCCGKAYAFNADVSAACAVLMDAASGTVLFAKNAEKQHSMASTTKIMTCLLACESGRMQDSVFITSAMLNGLEGTSLALKPGDRITLYDLVRGALLESGNDAANAIAYYLCGSSEAFVASMNERAAAIGMQQTLFVTPSGLDEGAHHSTAYDMALLAAEAMKNPLFASVCGMQESEITVNGTVKRITNHNKLLAVSGCFTGVKTGFTQKAGRCLVSSYRYHGSTMICVTLGAPDDWNDHIKLINAAKKQYCIYSDADTLFLPCVGSEREVLCGYRYSVASLGDVVCRLYYYPFVYEPFFTGETVGYAVLYCNGKLISKENITIM